jgi:hypothetical protein
VQGAMVLRERVCTARVASRSTVAPACRFFPALTGERCEQSVTISVRAGLSTLLAGVSAGVSGVSAAHVRDHVTCSAGRRRPGSLINRPR